MKKNKHGLYRCPFYGSKKGPEVCKSNQLFSGIDEQDDCFVVCCNLFKGGCGAASCTINDRGAAIEALDKWVESTILVFNLDALLNPLYESYKCGTSTGNIIQ